MPAVSRHRQVMNLVEKKPIIGIDVFLAPSSSVIGDVILGASSSVWYGAVLRADRARIAVGEGSSVEDRAVVRASDSEKHVAIGNLTRICSGSTITGSSIGDESVIGLGASVTNATIGKHVLIAAGSVVNDGAVINDGEVWAGSPALFVRKLSAKEIEEMISDARHNITLAAAHMQENGKTHDQIEAEKLRQQLLEERSDDYHSHIGVLGREHEIVETQARLIEQEREAQASVGRAK